MNKNYLIVLTIMLISCEGNRSSLDKENWYYNMKKLIMKDSEVPPDVYTTGNYPNEKSNLRAVVYFKNGLRTYMKIYRPDSVLVGEARFSSNTYFELRREFCKKGNMLFEGIFYKNKSYGLSTWWYCNGNMQEQGVRFKDKKVGVWNKWDEDGNIIEKHDYKNYSLLDSLKLIKYYQ